MDIAQKILRAELRWLRNCFWRKGSYLTFFNLPRPATAATATATA